MSRAFFDQIDDELRGLLGPALRNYESVRASRLIKVWYADPAIHFEVGLHLEHPDPAVNERRLVALSSGRASWAASLPEAGVGPALGPRAGTWRRVSEFLEETGPDDPELASEAAERLAVYVRTLWPILRQQALGNPGDEADPEIRSGA